MKHKRTQYVIVALFVSCIIIACQPKPYYTEDKTVQEAGWSYSDTLDYQFSVTDTSKAYKMSLNIVWADSFKHQNIYLKLGTIFPEGRYMQVVRSYDLYDQSGKPSGATQSGGYSGEFVLQETTRFNQPGTYHFTVAQHSREPNLTGIRKMSLTVDPQ